MILIFTLGRKKYDEVDLIANTDKEYIIYSIKSGCGQEFNKKGKPSKFNKLSFADTLLFIASSIEKLAKELRKL